MVRKRVHSFEKWNMKLVRKASFVFICGIVFVSLIAILRGVTTMDPTHQILGDGTHILILTDTPISYWPSRGPEIITKEARKICGVSRYILSPHEFFPDRKLIRSNNHAVYISSNDFISAFRCSAP